MTALRERFGALRVSPAYRTAAVGFDGPAFLNNAVAIDTDLPLQELDDWLHALEDAHGRDRSGPRFSDRTLDIDVVFYGDLVVEGPGHLRIPRPELKHAFVLKPLADIAPGFIDPVSGLDRPRCGVGTRSLARRSRWWTGMMGSDPFSRRERDLIPSWIPAIPQLTVRPPSTRRVWPVTKLASATSQ